MDHFSFAPLVLLLLEVCLWSAFMNSQVNDTGYRTVSLMQKLLCCFCCCCL